MILPLDVPGLGMQALLDPSVKKISIANPEHAPYGRAAVAAMQKAGVYEKVKEKFVMGENVSQALEFIDSGLGPGRYRRDVAGHRSERPFPWKVF